MFEWYLGRTFVVEDEQQHSFLNPVSIVGITLIRHYCCCVALALYCKVKLNY